MKKEMPELPIMRILAEDKKMRGGLSIPAFGVPELLRMSVKDYENLKVKIIESKLDSLDKSRNERIEEIREKGNEIVEKYTKKAEKIGWVPVGCIPFVHGICLKMIRDINQVSGIKLGYVDRGDRFANSVVNLIMTPFMLLPVLSAGAAFSIVQTTGEGYLKAVMKVIDQSTDEELANAALMEKRLKSELEKLKK